MTSETTEPEAEKGTPAFVPTTETKTRETWQVWTFHPKYGLLPVFGMDATLNDAIYRRNLLLKNIEDFESKNIRITHSVISTTTTTSLVTEGADDGE